LISRIGFTRNNTSKHNVLYTKEKVDELIDKVLHAKTVLRKKDPRNILGVIEEVSEYGYRVGTSVGTLSGYLCRNQIEAVNDTSLSISMISSLQISLREAVRKI
jgi:ethanolamine utilization protein EutA (predicted chaperonin)